MAEIQTKKPFHNLNLSAGVPVKSEPYNLAEMRTSGRFAFQYTKNQGGGLLKITHEVSINGVKYYAEAGAYPAIEETVDDADGYGEIRPKLSGYVILVAESVGGDITNLNGWMAVQ